MNYLPTDKMISLIADDFRLIQVMSRFGIKVGFGDKSVAEVCSEAGVDTNTFLAVVNFVVDGFTNPAALSDLSVESLLQYLRQSHVYFLEYCLPAIRRKLLDGIKLRTTDVSFLILKFFDEYYTEVRAHMEYEERTVFGYVRTLLDGMQLPDFHISTYSDHHEQVSSKLTELKNIIIKYCPDDADANLLNAALYDIYRVEEELSNHCLVEDLMFVPLVERLEGQGERSGARCEERGTRSVEIEEIEDIKCGGDE